MTDKPLPEAWLKAITEEVKQLRLHEFGGDQISQAAILSYCSGAGVWALRCLKLREALEELHDHSDGGVKYGNCLACVTLAELEADIAGSGK